MTAAFEKQEWDFAEAYDRGVADYYEGESAINNPYYFDGELAQRWEDGYGDAASIRAEGPDDYDGV